MDSAKWWPSPTRWLSSAKNYIGWYSENRGAKRRLDKSKRLPSQERWQIGRQSLSF
jgi:hypothetical protein